MMTSPGFEQGLSLL